MKQPERITLVLRASEAAPLSNILPFTKLGDLVSAGRGLAVIAGASEGDLQAKLAGREEGMSEETEVLTVEGLAKLLGRTEASIREGIRRGVPWLPKSFKMGNRHCWLKEDVRKFLREFRDGEHQKSKPGRKRKEPPSLRCA